MSHGCHNCGSPNDCNCDLPWMKNSDERDNNFKQHAEKLTASRQSQTIRFPLCEKLGLKPFETSCSVHYFIYAKDLERILEQGRYKCGPDGNPNTENPTQEGFLIGMRPIKDTAEGLLREFLEIFSTELEYLPILKKLNERARKLLSKA